MIAASSATAAPAARRPALREAPPPGPHTVHRDRLVRRLLAAPGRVVLLTAPAGYGKTTLLRSWEASDARPFVWLHGPMDLLAFAHAPERLTPPYVVVADGGPPAQAPRVRAAFARLADAVPRGSQLVVTSRGDASLPLSRLRLDYDVLELGVRDLALTHGEALATLEAAGAPMPVAEAESLLARLEGWPGAVALAGLTHDDGDDRALAQYVIDEALGSVPGEVLDFLRACSILDELELAICDALTGRDDAARMVAAAERSGAPIFRLDREGARWRCHPLVRDVLREQLRTEDPAALRRLHARAATWFDERDELGAALEHARGAGDVARVAELIWRAAPAWAFSEREDRIAAALAGIPARVVDRHAALAGAAALHDLGRGRDAHAAQRLDHAADALAAADGPSVRGGIEVLRAMASKDVAGLREHAAAAARILAPGDPWRGLCSLVEGAGALLAGDDGAARTRLEHGTRVGIVENAALAALCEAELALAALCADDWEQGACLAERAHGRVEHLAVQRHGMLALVVAVSAFARAHRGRFEEARADVAVARELVEGTEGLPPWCLAQIDLALSRAQLRLGGVPAARASLAEAARAAGHLGEAAGLRRRLVVARARADAAASTALPPGDALTAAELRVLAHLPSHLSFREIGARLYVSPNTIKTQAHAIYRKLGASSRSAAVARAQELGLLDRGSPGSDDARSAGAS